MAPNTELEENVECPKQLIVIRKKSRDLEAVETHAKMLIVGAGARFLFYPTLLYNVVRNKLQADFRWWDEIDQFLLLGAVPFPRDIPRLKNVGVHAVVTLNESYETLVHTSLYKNQGINHLVIPTRDYLFAPSLADIQQAVQFIHEHAMRGKRTYVHCKAGRGRSTTVVICYLVEHRGMTPLEALSFVRFKRPRVLLATSQWQAIQDYSQQYKSRCIMRSLPLTSNAQCLSAFTTISSFNDVEEGTSLEDLPVLIGKDDLVGYKSIEDAGLIGNELWKDIGLICRLRLVATCNMRASSSAWSKLSGFLVGSHPSPSLIPSTEATCKKMSAPSFSHALEAVPVCH